MRNFNYFPITFKLNIPWFSLVFGCCLDIRCVHSGTDTAFTVGQTVLSWIIITFEQRRQRWVTKRHKSDPCFSLKSARWLCLLRLETEVFPHHSPPTCHMFTGPSLLVCLNIGMTAPEIESIFVSKWNVLHFLWVFWWHVQKTLEIAKMRCFKITVTSRHVLRAKI